MGDNSPGSASPLHFMHNMMICLLLNVAFAGSRCAYISTLILNLYCALTRTLILNLYCALTRTLILNLYCALTRTLILNLYSALTRTQINISGTIKFISRGSSIRPFFNDLISNLLCRNLTLIGRPLVLPYEIYLCTSLTLISVLRKCATMFSRTLFVLLLLLSVVECGRPKSEIDTLFSKTTLATASKEVYLLKDFTVISLPLHINSIE
jgi:hypothetical protein